MERPTVTELTDGSKTWEHSYQRFHVKSYVPHNDLLGQINNYTFKAPLLLVFEEKKQTMEEAIQFAKDTGLASIAASNDACVYFIYPNSGNWEEETEELYCEIISEVKMDPLFQDGICEVHNFFTKNFDGYFMKGAIFRADIYSFGASADYVARNLLKTVNGQYLWGPGEITPAMCSMEGLSIVPHVERKDIGILSVNNTPSVNQAFEGCVNLLIKEKADYIKDFYSFVRRFKMWCGIQTEEPDLEKLQLMEEAGHVEVHTSPDNIRQYKDQPTHTVGYFAYYNKGLLDNGPVPVLLGFHGGGDSSMYLTYVAGWYAVAHKYNFLYISFDNHLDISATETIEVLQELKRRYPIDAHRIYASGFSMGSGKTWDLFQEYPEVFAGLAPCSALFPYRQNVFFEEIPEDRLNKTIPVPMFYSGGEKSFLPELPNQAQTSLERAKYGVRVNKCKRNLDDLCYEDRDKWENPIWGINGDRTEVLHDDSRDADLTIQYFDSEDGICRTALASVSNQEHDCRHHSIEAAWNFISQFTR